MKIFIMRHGEAEMLAKSDKARHLTENGKNQALQQGLWLKSNNINLDLVIVSPYARAIETLDQINQAYDNNLTDKTEIWDGLTPYGDAEMISDYLATIAEEQPEMSILLVSHLPLVGEIVAELCGKNPISYHAATIAQIEWDTEKGVIEQIKYYGR
ncbi:phosphohistidine phosphatase SixA [Basfia succiniciproducens]|uniref:Phosphohistidine phosphatase, SixA n=1 Tax=Basfia succiniciproducens TaxID=653940 RepID=A0A1G5AEG9_9PAST|nr:phosphohistidine phosphatase SixA [Basfia succiniciproducens]QIM68552.1 phosphohistidine phosphatase SixA [Basfia succiniciproducens]SCX76258.1 phosphohistidine phosphatase, SixA [Basfia succiniciproducens]